MITDNSFNFELSNSVQVGLGGNLLDSSSLTLNAPRMIDFNLVSKMIPIVADNFLKFSQSLKSNNKQIDTETNEANDQDLENAIEMSLYSCDKLDQLSEYFNKLILKNGICLFDGEIQMKNGYLNQINYEDYVSLLCKYCAKFIFPKQMLKNIN